MEHTILLEVHDLFPESRLSLDSMLLTGWCLRYYRARLVGIQQVEYPVFHLPLTIDLHNILDELLYEDIRAFILRKHNQ